MASSHLESRTTLFKALSEPPRLRIVALLLHAQECCVCELVEVLNLPQSMVSRHLAYLRNAGVLASRRDGAWVLYRVNEGEDLLQRALIKVLTEHLARDTVHAADRTAYDRHNRVCR